MKNYEYTESETEQLQSILKKHDSLFCKCGRKIDFGDIEWNDGNTEWGTPHSWVEIKCQACDTEIKNIKSWYPGIDDINDLLDVIESDWNSY